MTKTIWYRVYQGIVYNQEGEQELYATVPQVLKTEERARE